MTTNKLILGTVQFGLPYGINSPGMLPYESVVPILKKAHITGIETLDTAALYGTAHDVIGKFHKENPSHIFKVITKFPKDEIVDITTEIKNYCNQLQVSYLEGILFHSYDSYKANFSKNKQELLALKAEGIIKNIGVSIYTNEEFEKVIDDAAVQIIQLPFNVFDNIKQRGFLIEKATSKGKIIHTRSAFLQGLFFMDNNSANPVVKKLKQHLENLSEIITKEGSDTASLTLNYCVQQPLINNVLIGVDSLAQLEANILNLDKSLSTETLKELDNISIEETTLLNPSLWSQIVS